MLLSLHGVSYLIPKPQFIQTWTTFEKQVSSWPSQTPGFAVLSHNHATCPRFSPLLFLTVARWDMSRQTSRAKRFPLRSDGTACGSTPPTPGSGSRMGAPLLFQMSFRGKPMFGLRGVYVCSCWFEAARWPCMVWRWELVRFVAWRIGLVGGWNPLTGPDPNVA